MLIHLVADYGVGDLAPAEVHQQLALTDGPPDRVVYANVAPRADEDAPREDDDGEGLVAARLPNGVLVVAVDAGHAFSFLRDEADTLHAVAVPATGSQFRSRDAFPEQVARLVRGDDAVLGRALAPDAFPAPPPATLLYVDGYGNLKTSWYEPPAPSGTRVTVRIDGTSVRATASDGTFAVPAGEVSFAPGSSGWPLRAGGERRWYELLLRGGYAAEVFGRPAAGARVTVST